MNKRTLGSAVGRVGLRGAPTAAERVGAQVSEPVSSQAHDAPDSRAPDAATPQAPEATGPRAQGVAVARPVQYTLRLSYDESDRLDDTARALRRALSRAVDRSEVLRALIELAAEDPVVRAAVIDRLRPVS